MYNALFPSRTCAPLPRSPVGVYCDLPYPKRETHQKQPMAASQVSKGAAGTASHYFCDTYLHVLVDMHVLENLQWSLIRSKRLSVHNLRSRSWETMCQRLQTRPWYVQLTWKKHPLPNYYRHSFPMRLSNPKLRHDGENECHSGERKTRLTHWIGRHLGKMKKRLTSFLEIMLSSCGMRSEISVTNSDAPTTSKIKHEQTMNQKIEHTRSDVKQHWYINKMRIQAESKNISLHSTIFGSTTRSDTVIGVQRKNQTN